jgi:hypothetical protein
VVGRSLSHADRTSCLGGPGSRPLRSKLAAPPGLWPRSQLARCASGRAGWRLSRGVADGYRRSRRCAPHPRPAPSGPGCGLWSPPLPPIGLTAADLFAGGEVSRTDSRVRSPGIFTYARCPAVTSALDAGPEAYDNPAAVWWGAFAASPVIRDQVVIAGPVAVVAVTVPVGLWSCSPSPRSTRRCDSALACPAAPPAAWQRPDPEALEMIWQSFREAEDDR